MRYLPVPDSDLKLVDGNIVMIERFEDTKWVLHDGWFNYENRRYKGWYFVSIPNETVLPLSEKDLVGIILVSSKANDADPDFPEKPGKHHHDGPGSLYPPVCPDPEPERPAFFSSSLKKQIQESFISVPTMKYLHKLAKEGNIQDGKIVRVNNAEEGVTKYFIWSATLERWKDFHDFLTEDALEEDYYTKQEVEDKIVEYLEPFEIKTISITGEGTFLADAQIDDDGNVIITKGTPQHQDTGTGEDEDYGGEDVFDLIRTIHADKYGHITDVDIIDLSDAIRPLIEEAIAADPTIARKKDIPTWDVIE